MLYILVEQLVLDGVFQILNKLHPGIPRNHQVSGQRILRGADGPDMDMMEVLYAFDTIHRALDLFDLDTLRHPIQR